MNSKCPTTESPRWRSVTGFPESRCRASSIGGDPVKFDLVSSYNRPGGNVTGVTFCPSTMAGKRVQILHDLAPNAVIALFMNPDNPNAAAEQKESQEAARVLGHKTVVFNVRSERDFDTAFKSLHVGTTMMPGRFAALASS